MLSIKYPQVHAYIKNNLHFGLLPLWFKSDNSWRLIIKASKEIILTSMLKRNFKIYVAPIELNGSQTLALISAFFDDGDQPLVVYTPLFDEPASSDYTDMLLGEEIDIHFFDENCVEFLGYKTRIECPAITREVISSPRFAPFSKESAKSTFQQMQDWFAARTQYNDACAISMSLVTPLFPDDFVVMDARPPINSFTSEKVFTFNQLEREEPGAFQEQGIAEMLGKIFQPHQIFLNPLRPEDLEEIADIMVIADNNVMFVQAKDSPNTKAILDNTIERKKATTIKHLEKALRQAGGAISYARRSSQLNFLIGKRQFSVNIASCRLCSLIINKELFLDSYEQYSKLILAKCDEIDSACIALEYNELHTYSMNLRGESAFFEAYDRVYQAGRQLKIFPRLRFGLA